MENTIQILYNEAQARLTILLLLFRDLHYKFLQNIQVSVRVCACFYVISIWYLCVAGRMR